MSRILSLRISETHQLPGFVHRVSGRVGLLAGGFLAWLAMSMHGVPLAGTASAAVAVLCASVLLVSGRNAQLVQRDHDPA